MVVKLYLFETLTSLALSDGFMTDQVLKLTGSH